MQQTRQCLIRLVDLLQRYILGDRQLFVMVHLGSPLYNIRILLTVPFASGTGAAIARTSTRTPAARCPARLARSSTAGSRATVRFPGSRPSRARSRTQRLEGPGKTQGK